MNNYTSEKMVEILLVEDNPGYANLTVQAFKEGKVPNHLSVVNDGLEAMAFLHQERQYAYVPRPDLIVLDLCLPKRTGMEVLFDIKNDPNLRRIPVVILSISEEEEDVLKSYDLHANCYVSKPFGLEPFAATVKSIEDFWLNFVTLPSRLEN